jgi:hypothetical protein
MHDTLIKITRPTIKKMLKLYMSPDCGTNNSFVKEVSKTFNITEEESHLIWQAFDVGYESWFSRKPEQ